MAAKALQRKTKSLKSQQNHDGLNHNIYSGNFSIEAIPAVPEPATGR